MRPFRLRLPPDEDPTRLRVREWLAQHPEPTGADLFETGYVVPHWPRPWGLDADGRELLAITDELRTAGIEPPCLPLVRGYVGPLLLTIGTEEQRQRYLRPMLSGAEVWCQLFSEPEAGSDLAALRTSARREGDEYVVDGSKVWTTYGHLAQFGLLLARTDPNAGKHGGISCFICPMDIPGVTLTPIHDMTGEHKWNLVHFDGARLPDSNLIGTQDDGWRVARDVLANERMSMSADRGLAWGQGPAFLDLLTVARATTPLAPDLRARVAGGFSHELALHVMRVRALGQIHHEQRSDVLPEVRRALGDEHGQEMLELWRDLHGPAGLAVRPAGPPDSAGVADYYFFARALTIGGGTAQIQRNILAERVLGLPRR
jgi:alkylation response protein AidB-like acyl-CoA dehydrogenase